MTDDKGDGTAVADLAMTDDCRVGHVSTVPSPLCVGNGGLGNCIYVTQLKDRQRRKHVINGTLPAQSFILISRK